MLPPFQVRGLRLSATNPHDSDGSLDEVVADIVQLDVDGPWTDVRLQRENQYDEIIRTCPEATLAYLDEDDGDMITVGSSNELFSRIAELQPLYPVVFDILDDRGLPVWRVQLQQLNRDQKRITISRPSSPRSSSPRPRTPEIQSNDTVVSESSAGNYAPAVEAIPKVQTSDEVHPMTFLDMFETELARFMSQSPSPPEPESPPQNSSVSDRVPSPPLSDPPPDARETPVFETPIFNLLSTIPQRNQQIFSSLRSSILGLAQTSAQAARSAATLSRDLPVNEFENGIRSIQSSLNAVARDAAAAAAQAAEATRGLDVGEFQRVITSVGSTVKEIGEAYQHVGEVVGAEVKKVVRDVLDEVQKVKDTKYKAEEQTAEDRAREKDAIERAMREFISGEVPQGDGQVEDSKSRYKGKGKAKAIYETAELLQGVQVPESSTSSARKKFPPKPTVEDVSEMPHVIPHQVTVEDVPDEDLSCATSAEPELPEVFPIPIPEREGPVQQPIMLVPLQEADTVRDDITSPPSYHAATAGNSYLWPPLPPFRQSPVWPRAPEHDDEGESSDSHPESVFSSDDEDDDRDDIPGRFSPLNFGHRPHGFTPNYSNPPPVSPHRGDQTRQHQTHFNPWRNPDLSSPLTRKEFLRRGIQRRENMRATAGNDIGDGSVPASPMEPGLRHRMSCPAFGPMYPPAAPPSPHRFAQPGPSPPLAGMPQPTFPITRSPPQMPHMPSMPHVPPNFPFHHAQSPSESWRAPGPFGFPLNFSPPPPPPPRHVPPPPPLRHMPFVPHPPFPCLHRTPTFPPTMQTQLPNPFSGNVFNNPLNNNVSNGWFRQVPPHPSPQQQLYNDAVKRAITSIPLPSLRQSPEASRRLWLEMDCCARSVFVPFGATPWDRMSAEEQTRLWLEAGQEAILRASQARQQQQAEEMAQVDNPFATPPRMQSPIYMNHSGSRRESIQPEQFHAYSGSRPGSASTRTPRNPPAPLTPSRMGNSYSGAGRSPVPIPSSPAVSEYHSPYRRGRRSSLTSSVSANRNMYGSRGPTSSTMPMEYHSLPSSPERPASNVGGVFGRPSVPAVPIDQRHTPPAPAVPAEDFPGAFPDELFERHPPSYLHMRHRSTPPVPEAPNEDLEAPEQVSPAYFARPLPPLPVSAAPRAHVIQPVSSHFTVRPSGMPPFSSPPAHAFRDMPRGRNPFNPLAPPEPDLQGLTGHLQDGWIRGYERLDEEDEEESDVHYPRLDFRSEISSVEERRGRSPTSRGPRAQMDTPIIRPVRVHYAGWKQEEEQPTNEPTSTQEGQDQGQEREPTQEEQPKPLVLEKQDVQRDKTKPEPVVEEEPSRPDSPTAPDAPSIIPSVPPAPSIPRRSPISSPSRSPLRSPSPYNSPYRSAPSSPIVAGPSAHLTIPEAPSASDPFGMLCDFEEDDADLSTKLRINECIANLIDMGYADGDMGPEQLHIYAEAVGGDIEKALDLLTGSEEVRMQEDLDLSRSGRDFTDIQEELGRRERESVRAWTWWE